MLIQPSTPPLWTPPPRRIESMGVSGASQIPRDLVIGGVSQQATCVYLGTDYTGGATWVERYGAAAGTLTKTGTIAADVAGPFTDATESAQFDGASRLASSVEQFAAFGNDDVVQLAVLYPIAHGAVNQFIIATRSTLQGWVIYRNTAGAMGYGIRNTAGTAVFPNYASAPASSWIVLVTVADASEANGCGVWINGVKGGTTATHPGGTVSNEGALTIGSASTPGSYAANGTRIALFAQWQRASWFTSSAQWDAIASELTSRVLGTYAPRRTYAVGYPTVTRASTRYAQVGAAIHAIGDGAHCVEQDAAGDKWISVYGAYTNGNAHPNDYTQWTTYQASQSAGAAGPIVGTNWNILTENASNSNHSTYRVIHAATAQNTKYVTHLRAKKGNRTNAIYNCMFYNVTWVRHGVIVDLDAGTITAAATDNADVTVHGNWIVSAGDYWDLFSVVSCSRVAPGDLYLQIGTASGPTFNSGAVGHNYVGNAATYPVGLYWCGVVCAPATGPLPYIPGSATKAAEVISAPVGDYSIPGTAECIVRTWDSAPTDKRIWAWYDADADGIIELYLDADAHVHLRVHDGTGETADVQVETAINDGAKHRIIATWDLNYVRLRVDNSDAVDTTCTMPTAANLDTARLGGGKSGNYLDGQFLADQGLLRSYPFRRI